MKLCKLCYCAKTKNEHLLIGVYTLGATLSHRRLITALSPVISGSDFFMHSCRVRVSDFSNLMCEVPHYVGMSDDNNMSNEVTSIEN